jgi:hypothetical protein
VAPVTLPVYVRLAAADPMVTYLKVITESNGKNERSLKEQVLDLLAQGNVLAQARLRDTLAINNERLGQVLEALE